MREAMAVYWRILRRARPGEVAVLFTLMLMCSVTEGIGVALLVPFLEMIGRSGDGGGRSTSLTLFLQGDAPGAPQLLAAFVALVTLRGLLQYARDTRNASFQNRLIDSLRLECFRAVIFADWRWQITRRRSDHASALLTDIPRVNQCVQQGNGLVVSLFGIGVYVVTAVCLSPVMALVAAGLCGAVLALLGSGQHHQARMLGRMQSSAVRDLHGQVSEGLAGARLTKILGSEAHHVQHVADTMARLRSHQVRFVRQNARDRAVSQVGAALAVACLSGVGIGFLDVPMARLIAFGVIAARMLPMVLNAHQQMHQWLNALPAAEEIERLIAEARAHEERQAPAAKAWTLRHAIRLEDVTVRYPDMGRPALCVGSLTIPARMTTAIMGPSGSGKSTLADVVAGLLTADLGCVTVDGRMLDGQTQRLWRTRIAYVPQESFFFADTIRNNLAWGNAGSGDEAITRCLCDASAQFVFDLPAGLDTWIGDGGVQLSGGERQRLALARALLHQPELLILDESTSALDLEHERKVREAIERLHGNVTMIVIGHRLPTLEHADQVIILEAGRIAASGTWADIRGRERAANLA